MTLGMTQCLGVSTEPRLSPLKKNYLNKYFFVLFDDQAIANFQFNY